MQPIQWLPATQNDPSSSGTTTLNNSPDPNPPMWQRQMQPIQWPIPVCENDPSSSGAHAINSPYTNSKQQRQMQPIEWPPAYQIERSSSETPAVNSPKHQIHQMQPIQWSIGSTPAPSPNRVPTRSSSTPYRILVTPAEAVSTPNCSLITSLEYSAIYFTKSNSNLQ